MENRHHFSDADIERMVGAAIRQGAGARLDGRLGRRRRRRMWTGHLAGMAVTLLLATTVATQAVPTHQLNYRLEGYTLEEAIAMNQYLLSAK